MFSKQQPAKAVLEFNSSELKQKIANAAVELHGFRHDLIFKMFKRVFEMSRNVQILEFSSQDPKRSESEQVAYQRGRLEALTDVVEFFEFVENKDLNKQIKSQSNPKSFRVLRTRGQSETIL
jgi:hypothetical protein